MRMTTLELGGLTTRVVDADDQPPKLAVILCHGFGASGTDLVPLGPELIEAGLSRTRFYFPEAPLDLSPLGMFGSRAWWMIDFEALQQSLMEGTERPRHRNDRPEGLLEAREAMIALIDAVRAGTGLELDRIALGGFSQGAMLTADVTMQLAETPAALLQWSGTLLNEDEWRAGGARHRGLPVIQSHGRQDPILPFHWAQALRDLFADLGMDVDFIEFDGPHTIPPSALARTLALLGTLSA